MLKPQEHYLSLSWAVDLAEESINDLRYLAQEIDENFFNIFDPEDRDDSLAILYEYPRYSSLFRILYSRLWDIQEILRNAQPHMKKKETAQDKPETVN